MSCLHKQSAAPGLCVCSVQEGWGLGAPAFCLTVHHFTLPPSSHMRQETVPFSACLMKDMEKNTDMTMNETQEQRHKEKEKMQCPEMQCSVFNSPQPVERPVSPSSLFCSSKNTHIASSCLSKCQTVHGLDCAKASFQMSAMRMEGKQGGGNVCVLGRHMYGRWEGRKEGQVAWPMPLPCLPLPKGYTLSHIHPPLPAETEKRQGRKREEREIAGAKW